VLERARVLSASAEFIREARVEAEVSRGQSSRERCRPNGKTGNVKPIASAKPTATSPEITCQLHARAGSLNVLPAVASRGKSCLQLFNIFYLKSCPLLTRIRLCESCEKNILLGIVFTV
jgi:hypothetical protein